MRSLQYFALAGLAYAQTGQLGDATPVLDNPVGAAYEAKITKSNPAGVEGRVVAIAEPKGVRFNIEFSGLPTVGGPFPYHIHVAPVPENGNCTATLAHLDPFIRGETPPCDSTKPATCQVGDLSGKYGKINGTSYRASYVDAYASLKPGIGAFFGNRSIVLHYANKTRIACANFVAIEKPAMGSGGGYGEFGPPSNGTGHPWYSMPSPSSTGSWASHTSAAPMSSSTGASSEQGWSGGHGSGSGSGSGSDSGSESESGDEDASSGSEASTSTSSSFVAMQTTNGAGQLGAGRMMAATVGSMVFAGVMSWCML